MRAGDTSLLLSLAPPRTRGGGFGEGVRLLLRNAERSGSLTAGRIVELEPDAGKVGAEADAGIFACPNRGEDRFPATSVAVLPDCPDGPAWERVSAAFDASPNAASTLTGAGALTSISFLLGSCAAHAPLFCFATPSLHQGPTILFCKIHVKIG